MKTAVYLRVSTEDKGQDTAMQREACMKYCNFRDLGNVEIFEDKKSGRKTNRPEFQRMLGLIIAGEVKFVVAYKLDRLSRSVQDLLRFASICKEFQCYFAFATQPQMDTSSPMGNFLFTIMAAFAEFESAMISERTRDGMAQKKREGQTFGGDRKSISFNVERIKPYLFRERPWSLLKIREALKLKRDAFYRSIAWLENESDGIITDYSDERYSASARPFKYKRVGRDGKYLNPQDPRKLLIERERHLHALREVAEFFGYLEESDSVENFVNLALQDTYKARELPAGDELFD